jgi:hypothetical protein
VRGLLFRTLTIAVALALTRASAGADPLAPAAAYAQALGVMGALVQSPFATFTASVTATGAGVALSEDTGVAALSVGFGKGYKPAASWQVNLRSADGKALIHDAAGTTLVTRSQLFKPTWQGAYQWARYGFGHPPIAAPQAVPLASPAPDDVAENVIGRTTAIAPGAYRIEDGDPQPCPNAAPGRHLHLTALIDPATHPLTDIIIENAGGRICTMRFNLARGSTFSLTGTFDLDFDERGGYWVVVNGSAHVLLRAFGIGAKHASMTFDYTNFAFSAQPPDPQLAATTRSVWSGVPL